MSSKSRSSAVSAEKSSLKAGAQIIVDTLIDLGVDTMFGYPGGVVLPIFDALYDAPLRFILTRHEQGAAHAADGYARATAKVGVCLATSGPGATNLTTGIANAYMDSIPMVAITGQVKTFLIGNDAFQEADVTGITRPITKHNYLVKNVKELAYVVREAFYIASTGRPGPVVIDIPSDIQLQDTEFVWPDIVNIRSYKPTYYGHPGQIKKAAKLIAQAKKPVLYIGGGIITSGASLVLRALAEKIQAPVTWTLMGIGGFPATHKLALGMLGMHGTGYANHAIMEADLIIAVGARFDDRVTGRLDAFAPHAKVIHIDIDPAEIGKNVRVDVPIVGDARVVLQSVNKMINSRDHINWVHQLDDWRREHPSLDIRDSNQLLPQYVVHQLYKVTRGEAIITTGVGQNQMWAAQYYWFDKPNTFISSGGLGTMGFGLPASMGVKVGSPESMVWLIDGDGSFQMTLHELGTIVQDKIGVKIAILNNGYLGMVRQWQQMFYGKRYVATPLGCPDFVKIAEAYGMPGLQVTRQEDVAPAIQQAMAEPGPFLINFVVEPEENVYPMVAPGASLGEVLEAPTKEAAVWPRRNTP